MSRSTPIPPKGDARRLRMAEAAAALLLRTEQPRWRWDLVPTAAARTMWADAPEEAVKHLSDLRAAIAARRTKEVMLVMDALDNYWGSLDDGDEAK